jgi:hypothetical protein
VAVTGGQAPAHAPLQADVSLESLTHRYTARPEPSVRNVSPDDEAVVMTVEPDPLAPALDAPAAPPVAAGELLLPPPLEHAAAKTATAAALLTPVASLTAGDIRVHMEFVICPSPAPV